MTNLDLFELWERNRHKRGWAKKQLINERALKQAFNIRKQMRQLEKIINYKVIDKYLRQDHVYKVYSQLKDKGERVSLWKRISMSLCSAFFYNSARRVHNTNEDYLLLSEGNMINMEHNSAFAVTERMPDFLIFTELSGRGSGIKYVMLREGSDAFNVRSKRRMGYAVHQETKGIE